MKLFAVAAIFLVALGSLIWVGLASAVPVISVAELRDSAAQSGELELKDGQVRSIESFAPLRFTVGARTGIGEPITVESPRTVPENFKVGIDVGLVGVFDQQRNVLVASRVLTKCPSKYEATKEAAAGQGGGSYKNPPPSGQVPASPAQAQ